MTKGFQRKLTLVGVGYRAQAQGDKLNLSLGFSHPVTVHQMPEGVKVETPTQTEIVIKGTDKQQVEQGRSRGACIPRSRALQGQGRPLFGRGGGAQGNQEVRRFVANKKKLVFAVRAKLAPRLRSSRRFA